MQSRLRVVPRYPTSLSGVILRHGSRPFFLGAAIVTVIDTALWLVVYAGLGNIRSPYSPALWHAHEFLFGYGGAVIAGFLLAALPSLTGRAPISAQTLQNLFILWLAGRIAMTLTGGLAPAASAFVDSLFLLALFIVVTKEIFMTRNWRSLLLCGTVGMLAIANGVFHLQPVLDSVPPGIGLRLGVATFVSLIVVVAGILVPNLTNQWFTKTGAPVRSRPFSLFDLAIIVLTVTAVVSWTIWPESRTTALLLANAAIGNGLRLVRWNGYNAKTEPFVWTLHIGYAWLSLGLLFLGLSILHADIPYDAGLQALTAGAIGTMTISVMINLLLNHGGRPLQADGAIFCMYALLIFAVTARVAAVFPIAHQSALVYLAGLQWCAAFCIFCIRFGAGFAGLLWGSRSEVRD